MGNLVYDKSASIQTGVRDAIIVSWMYYLSVAIGFLIIGVMTNDVAKCMWTGIAMFFWAHRTHIWAHSTWPWTWFHGWHHNPEHSQTTWGILIETYTNVVGSGGLTLIPYNILMKALTGFEPLNNYVLLYFSLLYSTFHMINYHYLKVKTHSDHHADIGCNFGPDVMDVVFQTKKDGEEYEDMNHAVVNNIGMLIVVLLLHDSALDPVALLERFITAVVSRKQ